MERTMKAMVIERYGGAAELKLMELPVPAPEDGEVLIELACTSVNPVDWKIREGYLMGRFPHGFPMILGWDAAGTVSALGKNVREFKIGDRVYAYCRKPRVQWGTYAEHVTMNADAVAPMPKTLSFAQAAAIPLTGLTAWQALFDFAHLTSGQTILVHAGAGGVGSMAIQFARHAGAKVYTTASRRHHDYVLDLGAHRAINYTAENFADAIRSAEPGGVDVVLDAVGGTALGESYTVVRPGGVLVSIVEMPDEKAASQHQIRAGFVFVSPNGAQLHEIARLVEQGAAKPPRIDEMRLEDAAVAQEKSRDGHVCGKIVLRIK